MITVFTRESEMLITCKCLNVAINTKSSNIQDIDISTLGLSATELSDNFFQEEICTVDLGRISKEQSSLVQVRNVENWIIHQCLNCSTNTHAIHREKGAACVLISKSLLSSDRYSVVFRILVSHSENDPSSSPVPTKFSVSQLPGPVQTAMAALQQQLGEAIQQETAKTEERVRAYSEQQYAALEEFREQAHRDHRFLARVPVKLFGQVSHSRTNPNSLDTEGLFDLEGMEENPTESFQSEEETDTDDSGSHDEGIHIPKGRGMHTNLAKSLPVNVPAFLPPSKRGGEELEDERLPQDPMDIAASIKALAKSVHGDANVFGDLPRPRFSTQI
ncbi:hypothetical protein C0J52_01850 [Blattella germanica]|nr:hypothetical protein C0J52_01850 [Blattella germanica]